MWWPRLLEGHPDLSWDDYEKDYSDLPSEELRRHHDERAEEQRQQARGDRGVVSVDEGADDED